MIRKFSFVSIFLLIISLGQITTPVNAQTPSDWYMAGANPARTSWLYNPQPQFTSTIPSANANVEWFIPIDAYIDQKTQLITANDKIYVSTSKGLYVFNYQNGSLAWRLDTELPLGHSPTVIGNRVYVAGHDKKVYALQDNGNSYQILWVFDEALSGYNTNPLVVNNTLYIGNRSGVFYAINTANGQKVWQYPSTGSPRLGAIKFSPAYDQATNTLYFAASDNKAYALDASTATMTDQQRLKWSRALLGDDFTSYWPVVTGNQVIFSGSSSYFEDFSPGTRSSLSSSQQIPGDRVSEMQVMDIFQVYKDANNLWVDDSGADENPDNSRIIGDVVASRNWIPNQNITYIKPWRMQEYLEDDPNSTSIYFNNPWRREVFVLNKTTGDEFTYDADGDGNPEYAPFSHWSAGSGNKYPVLADENGIIYTHTLYRCCSDAKGHMVTWNPNDPNYLGIIGAANGFLGATAEPQGFAGNGTVANGGRIYRTICCDRSLTTISIVNGQDTTIKPYGGNLGYNSHLGQNIAPGYDRNWMIWNGIDRLRGFFQGPTDYYPGSTVDENGKNVKSVNGIYHNHGSEQNPPIPYKGKLFIHRSNAILAIGPGPRQTADNPPSLAANPPDSEGVANTILTETELRQLLEDEIQKIVAAGKLRPGYQVLSQFYSTFSNYAYPFENPGETLTTLALAYPHLNSNLQTQTANLASQYYQDYFVTTPTSKIGWLGGLAKREAMPDAPEIATRIANNQANFGPTTGSIPFENVYSMWLYVQNVLAPRGASNTQLQSVYDLARTRTASAPVPSFNTITPSELNKNLSGYIGFIKLHEFAQTRGLTVNQSTYDTAVARRDAGINLWVTNFDKDNHRFNPIDGQTDINRIHFSIANNFMYLTPDVGRAMSTAGMGAVVSEALQEYETIAPFWFVSKFESYKQEGTIQHIFTPPALFQARAYILGQSRSELSKYLDAPYYYRGDLYYIQNLVATLTADPSYVTPTPGPTTTNSPTPIPVPGDANGDRIVDGVDYVIWLNHYNQNMTGSSNGDFNNDGVVDGIDYVVWLTNYS